MKLFHGSVQKVKNPQIRFGRENTDFGKGFYTTTNIEQAQKWALKKLKTDSTTKIAYVNIYEVSDTILENEKFNILKLEMQ